MGIGSNIEIGYHSENFSLQQISGIFNSDIEIMALGKLISTEMNKKTKIYFGPSLNILTENEKNTMEISGRLNRTAERYMTIMKSHGIELTEAEKACLINICDFGFMAPYEIKEMPIDVRISTFEAEGLDKEVLAKKLEAASFADLVSVVEELGF